MKYCTRDKGATDGIVHSVISAYPSEESERAISLLDVYKILSIYIVNDFFKAIFGIKVTEL